LWLTGKSPLGHKIIFPDGGSINGIADVGGLDPRHRQDVGAGERVLDIGAGRVRQVGPDNPYTKSL
jgi:hypothetical protein